MWGGGWGEKKEEEYRERERNLLHRFSKDSELTEEEKAILNARPSDEPGRSGRMRRLEPNGS